MTTRRILVVDDDRDLAELVALNLADLGHTIIQAHDGASALDRARSEHFDVVVLDLSLPGRDGIEVCQELRARSPYTAILMLTARSTELDRVLGLEVGADDYLTKPFSVREMVARVKALLRRMDAMSSTRAEDDSWPLVVGDLVIAPTERAVRLAGEPVELTAKEFDLLEFFARHPGRVFTRAQLLDGVWGYAHEGYEHTVNTHINRLRGKIEADPSRPRYILTVWGVGYKLPRTEELQGGGMP
jgi:DNA-binding response OmpR family regulator